MLLSLRLFQMEEFKLPKSISERENALEASCEEKWITLHMDNKEKIPVMDKVLRCLHCGPSGVLQCAMAQI